MASATENLTTTPAMDLENIAQMMVSNPQRAIEILEKELKEDMLGAYNLDLIKGYIRKRGTKMEVNGVELYYETIGDGPHVVLMCPGTPGTIASDYMPQMLPGGFDREKYTLVSFEPRGYGASVPPKRLSFQHGYQEQDAKDAIEIMEKLGHKKFSWIGWCAGGNIGIVAAALFPDRIRSLIVWGSYPVITENAYKAAISMQNVDAWSDKMLGPKLLEFDKEYLQNIFSALFKYKMWVYENNNGDCVKSYLSRVRCPTMVMWLKMDFFTEKDQVDVILENVPGSKLQVIEDGKHAFHLKYPVRFRTIVEEFLSTVP
jgi:valacyclovir hydrolase